MYIIKISLVYNYKKAKLWKRQQPFWVMSYEVKDGGHKTAAMMSMPIGHVSYSLVVLVYIIKL